jgi:hypothetical protein
MERSEIRDITWIIRVITGKLPHSLRFMRATLAISTYALRIFPSVLRRAQVGVLAFSVQLAARRVAEYIL